MFAGKSVGDLSAYQQSIIDKLDKKPAIIGHSFGGLLVQILAGRGLSAATVAIDPAPSRGVLPLPIAALRASSAVLSNPSNRHKAVALTFEQFRYGFANAVPEEGGTPALREVPRRRLGPTTVAVAGTITSAWPSD